MRWTPIATAAVITLVGEREEPIQEAAIRGGKSRRPHRPDRAPGARIPRMGASDVVPFIPIDGVTIEDCVAMARHVGEQIWKRYQIPGILPKLRPLRLSAEPRRTSAVDSSKGSATKSRPIPARRPDFGELRVHPTAGATVVGARKFLIAYNVFLNTTDVAIAKKIAKAGALLERRHAICEGARLSRARHGAGVHEPHRL